jgi:hypothetical protein
MIIFFLILSILIVGVLVYTTINLLKKNERLETIVEYQQIYMNNIDESIRFSSEKLKELDEKGSFKSDDEIGWFFKNILYIQQILDEFKLLNYDEIKKQENNKTPNR